ncbi:metallophosphoesterase [Alistipes sp.]|uniref:metallophosphoesterase n=1 Tax=Alistipes sp. TaxID=1872444 RepID=UPI003AF061E7
MLFAIITLMALGAIAADMLRWRRLRRSSPGWHGAFVVYVALTDLLLPAVVVSGALVRDNSTAFMAFAMWMFWAWMVTVLPRMAYYLCELLRLPHVGILAALAVAGVLVWGATAGRTTLHVTETEVCSAKLPEAFDGLRIVQLSDIHVGTLVRPERELSRLVDSVNSLRPDLVVFTGDLANVRYTELNDRVQRLLGGLHAPLGVYSVTGNHDVGAYIKDTVALPPAVNLQRLIAIEEGMGWQVLQDTTVYLHRGGDSIALSGIAFDPALRKRRHDAELPPARLDVVYRDVADSLFNLTAVHLPQLWGQITGAGYGDVTLAGHVHAMQLKIRLFGRYYSPAQWLYTQWSGRYDDGPRMLYINDGTGYVAYPMRLGAWPEITLITLRRCA